MWRLAIISACSLFWALNASEALGEFEELGKKQKTGCNNVLNATNGAFILNDHTLLKGPCYWHIIPHKTNSTVPISLSFFHVFLHEKDNLNLYETEDDAKSGTNPLLHQSIQSQNGTITIMTNKTELYVSLLGEDKSYQRILEGHYTGHEDCSHPVPPDVDVLYSPIYFGNITSPLPCKYLFNEIPHKRVTQVFTFEKFNMPSSTVKLEGSTKDGDYNDGQPPIDFFISESVLTLTVDQPLDFSNDHFTLRIQEVDSSCSGLYSVNDVPPLMELKSPPNELNNGSISTYECRWVIQGSPGKILGLKFDKLDFSSVFDIVAVNDGLSEFSPAMVQLTTSNKNITENQVIRASSNALWISFKPLSYESSIVFNITVHGQGGYFKDNGSLEMKATTGDDTAFLLEVKDNEVVMLNFDDSSFTSPATVSIYDGFDTSNLLTTLYGQVKFPILSRSSRMMVTGTQFSAGGNHFSARFKGVVPSPGCNHMSSLSTESYILSENCNNSCVWVIPPQNVSNSALVVYLQYLSLKEGDNLKIHKLDASLTQLAEIGPNESFVPHFTVPSNVGVLINVTQAACEKKNDKIVLIGHYSYIPDCSHSITSKASEFLQITSPLYPDTYPVFTSCHWNISVPRESIVHMAFQNLNLAKNHCIKISQKSGESYKYEGKTLPSDLCLTGDVIIDFDSSGCNKTQVGETMNSDTGFLLNVTVADCGAVLDGKKSGEFNTSMSGNKTLCIWRVSVPPTEGSSVNIVSYTVSEKDKLKNYELHIYDGSTVRDSEILNNTGPEIWSQTNILIFVFRRLNVSQASAVLNFKYNTISCNQSMQCDNKRCMHPDWKCNGLNECGDYSDERNCNSVPIPPEIIYTGYSATAFWLCVLAMLVIGVIFGIIVPVCYQKYRDSRYRRFHELES